MMYSTVPRNESVYLAKELDHLIDGNRKETTYLIACWMLLTREGILCRR